MSGRSGSNQKHVTQTGAVDWKRQTVLSLQVLAQDVRLDAFRLLVEYEPEGLSADEMARALKVSYEEMTTSLKILEHASLVKTGRRGRLLIYRAHLAVLQEAMGHVLGDCCEDIETFGNQNHRSPPGIEGEHERRP